MTKKLLAAMMIVAAIVCAIAWQPEPVHGRNTQQEQWEYKVVETTIQGGPQADQINTGKFNNALGDGWGYIEVLYVHNTGRYPISVYILCARAK